MDDEGDDEEGGNNNNSDDAAEGVDSRRRVRRHEAREGGFGSRVGSKSVRRGSETVRIPFILSRESATTQRRVALNKRC
jgi:hypothetical protein